jgi:sugar lactone lactonase YvrE
MTRRSSRDMLVAMRCGRNFARPKGVVIMKAVDGAKALVLMLVGLMLVFGATSAAAHKRVSDPTQVTAFGSPAFAEGLAADRHGNLFASVTNWDSLTGQIVRISPTGVQTPYGDAIATDEGILTGVAFDQHGRLYVGYAPFSDALVAGVFRIDADGTASQVVTLPAWAFPNGLAFHAGYLYISDSWLGAVWRVRPDGGDSSPTTPWLESPLLFSAEGLGANGIAFHGDDLYIAVSDPGRILRVSVTPNRPPGELTTIPGGDDPALAEVDGITFDAKGNLYAATNTNAILCIHRDGTIESIVDASWLDYPTMAVFGTGPHLQTTLFIENGSFFGETPNLIALDVGVHGRPLR